MVGLLKEKRIAAMDVVDELELLFAVSSITASCLGTDHLFRPSGRQQCSGGRVCGEDGAIDTSLNHTKLSQISG